MHVKFLSLQLILLCLISNSYAGGTSNTETPFHHKSLSQCFTDVDAFISTEFGEAGLKDQNITRSEKSGWTWVVDQTSSKNYSWYLLKSIDSKKCLGAYIPAASDVKFKSKNQLIEAVVSPEADLPSKKIILKAKDKKRFVYVPNKCFLVKISGKGEVYKSISCDAIFD